MGDVDGDGEEELLVAALDPGALFLWRPGEAAPSRRVALGGYPLPPRVVPGVLPGPGCAVAVASRADETLVLFDLHGDEPRELWSSPLPAVPRAFDVGDLGGDGTLELVVACDAGRGVLANERGETRAFDLPEELPRCVHVARDGSGFAVGLQVSREVLWFPCEGDTLGSPRAARLPGIPRAIRDADVDGDGDAEVLVAGGDRSLYVFGFGEPGGAAAAIREGAVPLEWSIGTIPFDLEVFATGSGEGWVALNHSGLTYTSASTSAAAGPPAPSSAYVGQTPRDAALVDWNGDGRRDLCVANRDARAVSVLIAGDAGVFGGPLSVYSGKFPNTIGVGDLTGDGRPEVLALNSKDDTLSVFSNHLGELSRGATLPTGRAPSGLAVLDVDGDGNADVVSTVSDAAGARLSFLFGDGGGSLARRADVPDLPFGRRGADLLACDLDGDGRDDLVAVDPDGDRVVWYRNGGESPYLSLGAELSVPSGPVALARIEVDGDPLPEIAAALGGPGPRLGFVVLELRGAELVELVHVPVTGAPLDLVAADVDGDGRDDVAILANDTYGASTGHVQVFLLTAPGDGFEARQPVPTDLKPRHLAAGDFDGDGRADLAVTAQNAHVVDAWRSGETGLERLPNLGAGLGCLDLAVADLDGDGFQEILVLNAFSDDLSVLRNAGR